MIKDFIWCEPRIIANPSTWIEGEAIEQLRKVASFDGMVRTAGMPDLHPGKGGPVGGAFLSTEKFYPFLIGSDAGCGIGLWRTNRSVKKFKVEQAAKRLAGLDQPWTGDVADWLKSNSVQATAWDHTIGTPGLGNHFLELQTVQEVMDSELFEKSKMDTSSVYALVHSGSRGVGGTLLRDWTERWGSEPARFGSEDAVRYLADHNNAVDWARANRKLCAYRMAEELDTEIFPILDICHNSLVCKELGGCMCWLHRKGAAPSDSGPVVIAGSRGDLSFIVQPINSGDENLWSLAHGAGRKVNRGEAKGKLKHKFTREELKTNRWGGKLVCGDDQLVWEEAPQCYKNIQTIIDSLVEANLIRVIASMQPLLTFKTSEEKEEHFKQDWKRERKQARDNKEKERWQ